jgi:pseudouridine synthase
MLIYKEDWVYLDQTRVAPVHAQLRYFKLNKPVDYITAMGEGYGTKQTIQCFLSGLPEGVVHVGRLDKETTGLLLLTNDGDLNNAILQKGTCEKEYHLLLWGGGLTLEDARLQRLLVGVELKDGTAQANSVRILDVCDAKRYCPEVFVEGGAKATKKRTRGGEGVRRPYRDEEIRERSRPSSPLLPSLFHPPSSCFLLPAYPPPCIPCRHAPRLLFPSPLP